MEKNKINLTQQKHAFTNRKKCTTTQSKHKKLQYKQANDIYIAKIKKKQSREHYTPEHTWGNGLWKTFTTKANFCLSFQ